jgi:hypothetical protein
MDVQILCLDAANGDDGVRESGRAQVNFTIALREVSRTDTAWVETRAALGELSQAGFPVSAGFVATTVAFERFLGQNGFRSGHTLPRSRLASSRATSPMALSWPRCRT